MPLVAAKCTQCGAELQVDNQMEAAICQHCGTPFIVEKAITNYNTYVTQNFAGANVTVVGASVDTILERAYMFLEDKKWTEAKDYADKALDVDPKCSEAYVAIFMAQNCYSTIKEISNSESSPAFNSNFEKALKYDSANYAQSILDEWKQKMYEKAVNIEMNRKTESGYDSAIALLNKIVDYKDARDKIAYCKVQKENCRVNDLISAVSSKKNSKDVKILAKCISDLESVHSDEGDALQREIKERISKIRKKRIVTIAGIVAASAVIIFILNLWNRENNYRTAVELYNNKEYIAAWEKLNKVGEYKDSDELLRVCAIEKNKIEVRQQVFDREDELYSCLASGEYVTAQSHYNWISNTKAIDETEKKEMLLRIRKKVKDRAVELYKRSDWNNCAMCCMITCYDENFPEDRRLIDMRLNCLSNHD